MYCILSAFTKYCIRPTAFLSSQTKGSQKNAKGMAPHLLPAFRRRRYYICIAKTKTPALNDEGDSNILYTIPNAHQKWYGPKRSLKSVRPAFRFQLVGWFLFGPIFFGGGFWLGFPVLEKVTFVNGPWMLLFFFLSFAINAVSFITRMALSGRLEEGKDFFIQLLSIF